MDQRFPWAEELLLLEHWKKGGRQGDQDCLVCLFLSFSLSFFFRAAPAAHGGSQARGQIGATAASLHHSHSSTGSEPHL